MPRLPRVLAPAVVAAVLVALPGCGAPPTVPELTAASGQSATTATARPTTPPATTTAAPTTAPTTEPAPPSTTTRRAPAPTTTAAPRAAAAPQPVAPQPAAPPAPAPARKPAPQPAAAGGCNDNYEPCVPDDPVDVDCEGGSGNGPSYVEGPVRVVGEDVYDLDRDGDGTGCD